MPEHIHIEIKATARSVGGGSALAAIGFVTLMLALHPSGPPVNRVTARPFRSAAPDPTFPAPHPSGSPRVPQPSVPARSVPARSVARTHREDCELVSIHATAGEARIVVRNTAARTVNCRVLVDYYTRDDDRFVSNDVTTFRHVSSHTTSKENRLPLPAEPGGVTCRVGAVSHF
jgi:hypothetical protein